MTCPNHPNRFRFTTFDRYTDSIPIISLSSPLSTLSLSSPLRTLSLSSPLSTLSLRDAPHIQRTMNLLILFSFSFSLFLVYLYKCHIAATLCGSCVSLTTKEYQCGWCPEKTSCTVNDDCSAQSWIEPNGKCKAKPTIMEVYHNEKAN